MAGGEVDVGGGLGDQELHHALLAVSHRPEERRFAVAVGVIGIGTFVTNQVLDRVHTTVFRRDEQGAPQIIKIIIMGCNTCRRINLAFVLHGACLLRAGRVGGVGVEWGRGRGQGAERACARV